MVWRCCAMRHVWPQIVCLLDPPLKTQTTPSQSGHGVPEAHVICDRLSKVGGGASWLHARELAHIQRTHVCLVCRGSLHHAAVLLADPTHPSLHAGSPTEPKQLGRPLVRQVATWGTHVLHRGSAATAMRAYSKRESPKQGCGNAGPQPPAKHWAAAVMLACQAATHAPLSLTGQRAELGQL